MVKRDKLLSVTRLVIILATIASLSYVIAAPRVGDRATEFYLLDLQYKATEYPSALKVGEEEGEGGSRYRKPGVHGLELPSEGKNRRSSVRRGGTGGGEA